jgi:uncharacterized protein YPO0396
MMNTSNEGYALERLEVYNWGTFNKVIYTIEPNRETALLTGKNGSGKSTLVDALLTLLVPNRKRTYNQASGDRRKERDEKTYVRGAYNRLQGSGVQNLRKGNKYYSVLLAVFHSPSAAKPYVTLAQVFWNDGTEKFHVVSDKPLSIAENFTVSENASLLKKSLRQAGADVYDHFKDYSASFRKLLHLRSEKALEIFSQTVSIKEIGSLNHFIREHMLEKTDAEAQIQKLRDNFHNLTAAHEALVKAERQQSLLSPIAQDGDKYDQLSQQIDEVRAAEAAIPHYFTYQRGDLLTVALTNARNEAASYETGLDQAQERYSSLDRERIQLQVALQSNETGQRLARLKEDAVSLQREQIKREENARKYNQLASGLEISLHSDAATFHANHQLVNEQLPQLEEQVTILGKQRDTLLVKIGRQHPQIKELDADIQSLQQRRSQIPRQSLDIRASIASKLGIDEDELPFAGELLRVRDEAQDWEGAVERVLHGFALNMLVPEQHYKRLSQYVNKQHLQGRLIYRRIDLNGSVSRPRPGENTLYYKIEVKSDSPYADWLRGEIASGFNYVCAEKLEDFHHERRAITLAGQVKHDTNRYEKDDRYDIHDRSRHILGWDNRAKLHALIEQRDALRDEVKKWHQHKLHLEGELNDIDQRQDRLKDFLRFDDFSALDWLSIQVSLNENAERQRALESGSNELRQLQVQLETVEQQYGEAKSDYERFQLLYKQCAEKIDEYGREYTKVDHYLAAHPLEQWRVQADIIHREVERLQQVLNLQNLFEIREQVRDTFNRRANNYVGQRSSVAQSLERQIAQFRMEYQVETENIGSGLAALPELKGLLQRIIHEDLPQYRARFKEMLNKKVLDNIESFQTELESHVEDYRSVIEQLNTSLAKIPYETSAYIQLQAGNPNDVEISDFRSELRACFNDAFSGMPDANERAFERVSTLINRFEKEERWTNKVTDVRNWLDFAAIEFWKSDHTQKRFHSDSSGMSGGQKAKLAYTILASAVAYQYGTNSDDKPEQTFRFVVVDEAFSKVDDNNARYAMDLFAQLGLQLLVVTPMDKLPVVEPYAGAYHLVLNNEDGSDSRVLNLTVEAFRQQREKLSSNVKVAGD